MEGVRIPYDVLYQYDCFQKLALEDLSLVLLMFSVTSIIAVIFLHSGIYGDAVTLEALKDFHRRRVQVLADSGADIIAFETIPNKLEAEVTFYAAFG